MPEVGYAAFDRRVPMDNQTAEIGLTREERFSNPKKIALWLLIEGTIGIYTGVDEESQSVVVADAQRTDPVNV
jgi:hypothetical protein